MGWDGGVLGKFTISSMPPTVAIQCFCALSVPLSLILEIVTVAMMVMVRYKS
jgi:hypothetical protein